MEVNALKKFLLVAMAIVLLAAFTACGGQDQEATVKDTSSYAEWTKEDWENAAEEQQTEVAEKVYIELGSYAMDGYEEVYEEALNNPDEKELVEQGVQSMRSLISQHFEAAPDSTIGAMVDESKKLIYKADYSEEE